MAATIIKGHKALAERIGVHPTTVYKWSAAGILDKAKLAHRGRTILYDLDKALKCLNGTPGKWEALPGAGRL